MTTLDELIMSIEVEREQAQKTKARAIGEVKAILNKARNEGRSNMSEQEDADCSSAFATRDRAIRDLTGIEVKYKRAKEAQAAEREIETGMEERTSDPTTAGSTKPAYDRVARVGQEERTYHRGNTGNGGAFIRDVTMQFLYRDMAAETRLVRHMQEERVERGQYMERAASGTGNFSGLTVPQYLTDMYAPKVAALRPFADQCNKHDLPTNGMTINISRITTGETVALQASENTAIADGAIADTLLTEPVQTAAGQQTLSRQAIDRATGVEDIVMDDLFRRYASTLDNTLVNQATTGLAALSTLQTFTNAAPTSPMIYGQIIGAASGVESVLLGWAQPDLVVMSPRRWYGLLSAVTPNWPMIYGATPAAPVQASGSSSDLGYAKGIRGVLANGLRVCVDANVVTNLGAATNQDQIYVVPSQECHLWEDPNAPVFIRAEQPAAANLGVVLVLYGYFAYTFRRFPGATVKIDGTGLTPPPFTGV